MNVSNVLMCVCTCVWWYENMQLNKRLSLLGWERMGEIGIDTLFL